MADFNHVPSYSSSVKTDLLIKEAKFGDGYSQRSSYGINSVVRTWNLRYENISQTVANQIKTFIKSKKGVLPFTWEDPEGEVVNVICKSITESYKGPTSRDLSLNFTEVFD